MPELSSSPFRATPPSEQQSPALRSRQWSKAVPVALLLTAAIAVIGLIALRPHIAGVAVPNTAQPDSLITVTYRATGLGTADYAVLRPDGQTLMHAPLGLGTGTIGVTLPRAPASQTYVLRLRAGNYLASTTTDYYIAVPVVPAVPAASRPPKRPDAVVSAERPPVELPQIRSLALDRATLAGGDALGVYYDVDATDGTITLLDSASRITYAKVSIAASGHTSFTMPHVDEPRLLTVVLAAQRGTESTQSRVGVNVVPADASSNPGDAAVEPSSAVPPGVLSAPPTVRSGQPIRVEVSGARTALQVSLLDAGGTEFERREVQAGQQGVDFTAPEVRRTTRFTIEATFPKGNGSETLVREIAVTP